MTFSYLRLGVIVLAVSLLQAAFVDGGLIGETCVLPSTSFLLFDDQLNFNSAKNFCIGEGGTLARISSQEEYDAVKSLIEILGFESKFWIGIEDNGANTQETSRFSFVDGNPDTSFFRVNRGAFPWKPSNPDGLFRENCVEWSPPSGNLFNDKECNVERELLCRMNQQCPTGSPTTAPSVSPTFHPSASPTLSPTASPVIQQEESEAIRMVFLGMSGASALGIAALLIIIQRERKQLQEMKASFALLSAAQ